MSSLRAEDLSKARAALEHDDYSTAQNIADEACQQTPDNPEAWIVLGHALSGQIDHASVFKKADLAKRTLAAYLHAAKLAPKNTEVHTSLLEYYRQAPALVGGSRSKAYAEARVLIDLDAGLGFAWTARLAGEDHRTEEAFRACEHLLEIEPKTYRALYWFGATSAMAGRDLERGEDALRRALLLVPGEDDPGLDEANVQLGNLLIQKGDKAGAIRAYNTALTINAHSEEAKAGLSRLK